MKTKLHFLRLTVFAALLSFQIGLAQTGGAFGGVTPTVGAGTIIEFENFDLGGNALGGTAPFGYSDKSPGNVVATTATAQPSTLRSGTDVDVADQMLSGEPTGITYVGGSQGGEFLYYSVSIGTSGKYHFVISYAHGSANNKKYRIERLNTDLTEPVVLVDGLTDFATTGLPKTENSSTFGTNTAGPAGSPFQFDLIAGQNYVIKFSILDAGPSFDYFQFIRDGDASLSTNSIEDGANSLKVFPNPATDGKFQLNIESKWDVYSVVGVKVLKGEGKNIDLSSLPKGVYILKTPFASKVLVSK